MRVGRSNRPNGSRIIADRDQQVGEIPKPHQPGKWRIIVDLSYPKGVSVNDGISQELCSLAYASIDDAERLNSQNWT